MSDYFDCILFFPPLLLDGGHAPRMRPGVPAFEGSGGMQPDRKTGTEQQLQPNRSVNNGGQKTQAHANQFTGTFI